jgi:murein DD-endopeptidase MepM/ murein hydrolase activator NlpD
LLSGSAGPEACVDPEMLKRVRAELSEEDPATRKDRLEHEVYAAQALAVKTPVVLPHREMFAFDRQQPVPAVYEIGALRGQEIRLTITSTAIPDLRAGIFAHDGNKLRRIAVSTGSGTLTSRVFWTGPHYLVLQAGAKASGQFLVELGAGASLLFPVRTKDSRAIKSFFGDRRGGGTRSHEGVDIFAPKGAEAVAAANGRVVRVGYSGLGGKVVWLADEERSRFFYYAHLDSFAADEGDVVRAGDVLGYVGNTGNARTTPPHLHFGVYAPRAVDPHPYLHEPQSKWRKITAKTDLIGRTVVIGPKKTSLYASPDTKSTVVNTLARDQYVRILGASAAFYRVLFEDGTVGWLKSDHVRALRRSA